MITDTHCHLTSFKRDEVGEVLKTALDFEVEKVIVPTTNRKHMERMVEVTEEHENVYGLVGVYPGEVYKGEDLDKSVELMRKLLEKQRIVGIGEIGLDGYWNEKNLEKEKEIFKKQLELALELDVPVAIHSRNSQLEIKDVFKEMGNLPRGQFHCFSGDEEFLEYVLEKGFYVSFCGNITYPSNKDLVELMKKVPLEKLLLETDAPYLPPQGMRGQTNTPANVRIIGQFVAKERGVTEDQLFETTSRNAKNLYNI